MKETRPGQNRLGRVWAKLLPQRQTLDCVTASWPGPEPGPE
jgi:hypothetical protein